MAIFNLEKKAKDVGETIGEAAVKKAKEATLDNGLYILKKLIPIAGALALMHYAGRTVRNGRCVVYCVPRNIIGGNQFPGNFLF